MSTMDVDPGAAYIYLYDYDSTRSDGMFESEVLSYSDAVATVAQASAKPVAHIPALGTDQIVFTAFPGRPFITGGEDYGDYIGMYFSYDSWWWDDEPDENKTDASKWLVQLSGPNASIVTPAYEPLYGEISIAPGTSEDGGQYIVCDSYGGAAHGIDSIKVWCIKDIVPVAPGFWTNFRRCKEIGA